MESYLELKAIDINQPADTPIESDGVAFYRLPNEIFDFLTLCQTKHGVLGFEWDGTRNFGVILRKAEIDVDPTRETK